jgi:DNA polymerase-3 subunit alpha
VHLSPQLADMEALKRRLRPAEGPNRGGEVILVAGAGDGREIELRLPGRFSLDQAVRGALKTAPGVAYLEEV